MADIQAILKRKVAGVPVLYLAAGFVAVLALYAWKTKSTTGTQNAAQSESDVMAGAADTSQLFPSTDLGTVYVQPADSLTGTDNAAQGYATNDDWLKAAADYLIKNKGVTPGEAQAALQAYLDGNTMSYKQSALKDAAIVAIGYPPYLPSIGGTEPQTAVQQTQDDALTTAIKSAYNMYLKRSPSTSEINYWRAQGLNPQGVYDKVRGSDEALKYTIQGYYQTYLGRKGSDNEVGYWVNYAKSKGIAAAEAGIKNSPEAKARGSK